MSKDAALAYFGMLLMNEVRDASIKEWLRALVTN